MQRSQNNETFRGRMPQWLSKMYNWIDDDAFMTLFSISQPNQGTTLAFCSFGFPIIADSEEMPTFTKAFPGFFADVLKSEIGNTLSSHAKIINDGTLGYGFEQEGGTVRLHVQLSKTAVEAMIDEKAVSEWCQFMVKATRQFYEKHLD